MQENRVVVTGLGAVTPIGIGVDQFWQGLVNGKNGISQVSRFDVTNFPSKLAAEIKNFDPLEWIDRKTAKRIDRFTQLAMAAATMAMQDSGLASFSFDPFKAGVVIGSGIGGVQTIEDGHHTLNTKGPKSMNPFFVSKLLINMAASMVSIDHGLKGPLSALSVACSTGSNAIGDAYRILQRGDAEIMIAGSAEASITPLPFGGFCANRSMTTETDPENASKPFDKERNGFVMGEGAGIVTLETLEHAQKRNAKIYAEISGYGNTSDAYHFTAPHPESEGMIRVMQAAIRDANLSIEDVEYINAHGTSTVMNDKCECAAIGKVFGDHAKKLKISSIKSMIGHLLAGSGSVEFVATVKSITEKKIPPTINYSVPDPDCPFDFVSNGAQDYNLTTAISNSFGFGGGNACLLVKKY